MVIKAKKGGVSQQQLVGVAIAAVGCRSCWVSQQQLGGVAVVKGGVALDRPYIYNSLAGI